MTAASVAAKTRPTNGDLQDQIAEAHECIHNVGDRVDAIAYRMDAIEAAVKDKTVAVNALVSQMAATDARVDLLVQFFGLKTPSAGEQPKRRITFGSLEWWQAVLGIAGSVLGALGAWKFLFPALVALHHALLTAH
jgi:hypothetical protein